MRSFWISEENQKEAQDDQYQATKNNGNDVVEKEEKENTRQGNQYGICHI